MCTLIQKSLNVGFVGTLYDYIYTQRSKVTSLYNIQEFRGNFV